MRPSVRDVCVCTEQNGAASLRRVQRAAAVVVEPAPRGPTRLRVRGRARHRAERARHAGACGRWAVRLARELVLLAAVAAAGYGEGRGRPGGGTREPRHRRVLLAGREACRRTGAQNRGSSGRGSGWGRAWRRLWSCGRCCDWCCCLCGKGHALEQVVEVLECCKHTQRDGDNDENKERTERTRMENKLGLKEGSWFQQRTMMSRSWAHSGGTVLGMVGRAPSATRRINCQEDMAGTSEKGSRLVQRK